MRNACFAALAAAVLLGCADAAPAGPDPVPVDVPPVVRLKDVVVPDLPSPYYHFEYDADGRVTVASFASELTHYEVGYEQGKIHRMTNSVGDHSHLEYAYDASGRVAAIDDVLADGSLLIAHQLIWSGAKLARVDRYRRLGETMVLNKTTTLRYDATGNLHEIEEHFPLVPDRQPESTSTLRFENYDSGTNVDGFSLLHTGFFDPLFLLPQVRLQTGNPRRVVRLGDGANYEIAYTYVYDANGLPVSKSGDLVFTSGSSAGQHFSTGAQFTYY